MEEDLTADLRQYKLPVDIDIPISHDVPTTTLDSLVQIKKEFKMKLDDAVEKNNTRNKGRYERQLKKFDDAIKATQSGKNYDYNSLQALVPPGFSKIPLNEGRPVTSSRLAPSTRPQAKVSPRVSPQAARKTAADDDLAGDDILDMLENELNMAGDDDDDDGDIDPEEERFNQQIKAAQKLIPNIPMPKDDIEKKIQGMKKQMPKQPKIDYNDIDLDALEDPPELPPMPNLPKLPVAPIQLQPRPVSKEAQPAPVKPSPQAAKTAQKHSKDLSTILERQRLFKEAALKAKQEGNTQVALTYLRNAKGFDSMIQAAESGLPLDMSKLPVPPQLKQLQSNNSVTTTTIKSLSQSRATDDLSIPINGDRDIIYKHLLEKLKQQVELATDSFKHYSKMGDIPNANKFKVTARESIADYEALKNADKLNEPVPLYHYEKRSYETIDCNSDLTDNDLEVTVIRGINYVMPKDYKVDHMNTFVKFEFPYPPDECQKDKTNVQSSSCEPEYNQSFKLQIQRKQTKFMRLMNRKELKLEVYIKGGFLRSDKLLAHCNVKLQPLETASEIHNAFELLDGRRSTGGKLEVKIRIREPLLHKGVQTVEHKWLIIDKFQLTKISI